MNGLILSFILHLSHTVISFYTDKRYTIHNLISLWFTIVIFIGILSVEFNIYQDVHGAIYKLPFKPYILEFLGFLIFVTPFKCLSHEAILLDMPDNNRKVKNIVNFIFFLIFLDFLLKLKVYMYVSQFDYVESYRSLQDTGETLYHYSPLEEKIAWICGSAYRWFAPLVLIYTIDMMIKDKKGLLVIKEMFYLFVIVGSKFLLNISRGQRGGTFWFLVLMILVFLPFYSKFSEPSKKLIKRITPVVVLLFFLYAAVMSVMRTETSDVETPVTQVIRYLGEPYPHFGNVFYDNVRFHPTGVRLFPLLFDPTNANLNESYGYADYWGALMGVPIENYPTMYGDLYCEFGEIGALIALLILSAIFYWFIRNKPYKFSKYPIVYFYLQLAVTGPYWFAQRGNVGVRTFIACIIIYLIIESVVSKKL